MKHIIYLIRKLSLDPAFRPVRGVVLFGLFGCGLLAARWLTTGEFYGYLIWNLYLAWTPMVFAYALYRQENILNRKIGNAFLLLLWLLFFPNSPYIITDFIHLEGLQGTMLMIDGILIFIFAFAGLGGGLLSLYWIRETLRRHLKGAFVTASVGIFALLSGYGVFLGRSLRWNSWDFFTNTIPLLKDCILHMNNKMAIAITIMFTFIILAGYSIFINLIQIRNENNR